MEGDFEDAFERHIEPDIEQQTAEADSWDAETRKDRPLLEYDHSETFDVMGQKYAATPEVATEIEGLEEELRERAAAEDGTTQAAVSIEEAGLDLMERVRVALATGEAVRVTPEVREQLNQREAKSAASRVAAKALAAKLLGGGVRLFDADALNGKYAGPVIGVTDLHVIQQITAQAAVLHRVDAERTGILGDLLADPKQPFAINYSQHTATLKELQQPGAKRDLARER